MSHWKSEAGFLVIVWGWNEKNSFPCPFKSYNKLPPKALINVVIMQWNKLFKADKDWMLLNRIFFAK